MPTKQAKSDLKDARRDLEKKFGPGTVMVLGEEEPVAVPVIPTGLLSLDFNIRRPDQARGVPIGGLPRGRITELFGPECIDGESFVYYEIFTSGKHVNSKGGTIRRLYERFHGLPPSGDGRGKWDRELKGNVSFGAPSVNEAGRIFRNRILDVVQAGEKECYEVVTTEGLRIKASADHEFFCSNGFIVLRNLRIGDQILTHKNVPYRGSSVYS